MAEMRRKADLGEAIVLRLVIAYSGGSLGFQEPSENDRGR